MGDTEFVQLLSSRLHLEAASRIGPLAVLRLSIRSSGRAIPGLGILVGGGGTSVHRRADDAPSRRTGTWFQLAIELVETGELIGDCGLHTLADRPGQAEIGITMACEHQGRGYATEAVSCLLDYVFRRLDRQSSIE